MEFEQVPLTHDLATTGRIGIPVWQRVAEFCAIELLPLEGWKTKFQVCDDTAHVQMLRWGRGADVTLVASADRPDVIRIFADPCSNIGIGGANLFGFVVALPVFVLMEIDRQGSLAALIAAAVAYLAVFCVAWPFTAIVERLFCTSEQRLRELSAFFFAALTDESHVAELAAEARQEPEPASCGSQVTIDDIEEEDFTMGIADLQRKYGYSKGNQIFRLRHRRDGATE